MALPDDRTEAWPPERWQTDHRLITESRLWLVGDVARLGEFYASEKGAPQSASLWRRMLQRLQRGQGGSGSGAAADRVHNPITRKIARTASMLLFSEPPALTIDAAHVEQDGDTAPDVPVDQAQATEARLAWLAERDGWTAKFQQGAYIASGTGGVYLRPLWNRHLVADRPILTVVHHDHAVPTFVHDQLVEVIFWRELEREIDGTVWRHLERHAPGLIEHALFAGDARRIGARHPLTAKAQTKALIGPEGADERGVVDLAALVGITDLLVDYVPNVLPHPVTLSATVGGADCAGLEDQMTALDSADTGWAKEVDLGRRRIIVPDTFLDHGPRGQGSTFDMDRDVFSPLSMGALDAENQQTITAIDFAIRATEFEATITRREATISTAAGYDPDTVAWANTGDAMTATEVLARDQLSRDTTAAKRRFWETAISSTARKMLQIDAALFGSGVEPMTPSVVWPSVDVETDSDRAQVVNLWSVSNSASTAEKVRKLHPNWTPARVEAEVAAILREQGVQVVDPMEGVE